jgi:hypothetical protein
MDESSVREHVREHGEIVVRGDLDALLADFSEELRPQVPQLAQVLPQPVTSAEVLNVEVGDAESVALIRYSGDDGDVTIRSRWQEIDGRPVIVHVEPVA